MKQKSYELFQSAKIDEILEYIELELEGRNESPIWKTKVVPFSKAILSVLVELRDLDILFNPEGKKVDLLTPELFFIWSDFVSLKMLAFTLQKSNSEKVLKRTKLSPDECAKYTNIDLSILGDYLASCNVNLENESLDFPISTYNFHQGLTNVIKSLL